MNLKFKEQLESISNCAMYKFVSILAYVEIVGIFSILSYFFAIENPSLRPLGTLLIAYGLSFVVSIVDIFFALILLLEFRFRRNMKDIKRCKFIHIGAILFFIVLVSNLIWFILNFIFSML